MTDLEIVKGALANWPQVERRDQFICVPTFGLYPSGAVIDIYITAGRTEAQVSDGGGAFDELMRVGEPGPTVIDALGGFANRRDLLADRRGWLAARPVPLAQIPAMIAVLAEATREAAEFLIRKLETRPKSRLKTTVDQDLNQMFGNSVRRKVKLQGAESEHVFDYAVRLSGQRQLVLDLVTPEPSSVNAAIVAHLDLRHRDDPNILQAIVYDPDDNWEARDVSLLSMAKQPIRASGLRGYLVKLTGIAA